MSKHRRSAVPPSVENPPADFKGPKKHVFGETSVAEAESLDVEKRIHEILTSEIGKAGFVRLYRRRPMEAEFKQLTGRLSLEQFSCDWVLETFGGGEYQVKAFGSDNRMIKVLTWSIDPSIPTKSPAAPGAPASGPDLVGLMKAAKENQGSGSGDNGMALVLTAVINSNTELAKAAQNRSAGGGGESDLLKILLPHLLAEKKQSSFDDMMKMWGFMDRVRKGEDPEEKEESSPLERLAEKLLPVLAPLFASKMGLTLPGNRI